MIRISIGFIGGQVVSARVSKEALEALGGERLGSAGWHDLALEDGSLRLELSQVAYVRVESDELRVGFGA